MLGPLLKYDYKFMSAKHVGKYGFKTAEVAKLARDLKKINKKIKQERHNPDLSWQELPYERKTIKQIIKLAKNLRKRFRNLVVVGIGGSDLGAKAIYSALAGSFASLKPKQGRNLKVYFLGDTTDPQPIADLLGILNLRETVFYIVSKSGNTIEPLATFLLLRKKVISKVGHKRHKVHFIITTNLENGELLEIAKKEDYLIIEHYAGGGRYSVLSINGLLPAACAGFDIKELTAGARVMAGNAKSNNYNKNLAFFFAALQYLAYKKRKQNISILMPYDYYLNEVGFWFRQLWGESLANKHDLKKKLVNCGITPIAALGPTDQHSQIQLYIEGPYDKIITFIKVANISNNFKVPEYKNVEASYFAGHKFKDILNIEHWATSVSLMENKRPNGTIILPYLDEYYLGQLFYFMEMAVYYLGEFLHINVFDQPGVEQSKNYMYGLLGKEGYEKYKEEIDSI